jgi:ribosomal protein L37AE/L43A
MSFRKINEEEEYIARKEFERKQKLQEEKQKEYAVEEKKRLKELHHMQCPKCGMKLIEIDYKGIKIDECSSCKGIWLDAGELESVAHMEKSVMNKFFSVFSG